METNKTPNTIKAHIHAVALGDTAFESIEVTHDLVRDVENDDLEFCKYMANERFMNAYGFKPREVPVWATYAAEPLAAPGPVWDLNGPCH